MNQLYLLRHGLAAPQGTPGVPDDSRPLTPEGERRIRQVGKALQRLDIELDRIATSPLPRALKTAQIVAEALGEPDLVEVVDELRPGRDASSIRAWLTTREELRLMVVGHNPSLSELLALLTTGDANLAYCELHKGGIASLMGDPRGLYRVDWIARSKLFRL
jgi:phosphohistidine phosphatase